ncbi:hypothetical protein GCM10023222_17770 [Saccharopolyspora cebuensis]
MKVRQRAPVISRTPEIPLPPRSARSSPVEPGAPTTGSRNAEGHANKLSCRSQAHPADCRAMIGMWQAEIDSVARSWRPRL